MRKNTCQPIEKYRERLSEWVRTKAIRIKLYLDFECLFYHFQNGPLFELCACECVYEKWTDSSQRDHIFPNHRFVNIAIFWTTQYCMDFMLSTWMRMSWVWHARDSTKLCHPKENKIKMLTLYMFYRLLLLFRIVRIDSLFCGQIKRATPLELRNTNRKCECESQSQSLFKAIFVMKFELHAPIPMPMPFE